MPADASPVAVVMDGPAFKAALAETLADALAKAEEARASLPDRLAYSEDEAARLLGLNTHQLRDERRRGSIAASLIVGKRVRYTRPDLMAYLMRTRTGPK